MNTSFISRFPPLVRHFGLGMFLLGATLAVGVVLASQAVGQAMAAHSRANRTIRVKGVGEVEVISDAAEWTGLVSARGTAPPECFSRVDASMAKTQSLIRSSQFEPAEITLGELTLVPTYAKNDKGVVLNAIESYTASQRVTVRSKRVEAVRDLQRRAADLQKDGVTISSGDPLFTCSTIDSVKMGLLEKAAQNGFDRAQLLAKNSGARVGTLANASQGVFQIVPLGSTEVSDSGFNDTTSIRKTAKVVVNMEYFIEP
jgi:hypothetical protein